MGIHVYIILAIQLINKFMAVRDIRMRRKLDSDRNIVILTRCSY